MLLMWPIIGPVEEFGWRGFALPLLQQRFRPIWAGLILGAIWGIWYLPALYLSGPPQSAWSFAPFFFASVVVSLIITPMFNASGGNILLPLLFHFQLNNPLFPDAQPYDTIMFVLAAILAAWINRRTLFSKIGAVTQIIPIAENAIQQLSTSSGIDQRARLTTCPRDDAEAIAVRKVNSK